MQAVGGESAGPETIGFRFENSYARLPQIFHGPASAAKFEKPAITILNEPLAAELGLEFSQAAPGEIASVLSGQRIPLGAEPIAQAYAGHQFGGFTMLGDGRAILIGEHRTPAGRLVDIQLKGPGRTRFSRGGDGLAALGPMLREYVISEAMAALGIPTTRSLAVVVTGQPVYRESIRRGAILTRVAASHLRVGTFEFAARAGESAIRELTDYAIARHEPDLRGRPEREFEFFRRVVEKQASLIARWQQVGFIHGVMNTDNMAISGETIDYGPCAFMNAYSPRTVFSSIDRAGRYSYGNQPPIAQWNLARFAETLLPLFDSNEDRAIERATQVLDAFPGLYGRIWLDGMRRKIGLVDESAGDADLVQALLDWMERSRADFTNTFRSLVDLDSAAGSDDDAEFQQWKRAWKDRRRTTPAGESIALMSAANPVVVPRNHRVEEALEAAERDDDLEPLRKLLEVISRPFEQRPESAPYRQPPDDDSGYRTFCGT